MKRIGLLKKLDFCELLARGSKFGRFLNNPSRYVKLLFFTKFVYKVFKRSKVVKGFTFFNAQMVLKLPSSADILLIGAKSHSSEINLAKFIIRRLEIGDVFIDVGAHYGYFSLLASLLVEERGKVYSFEASLNNYNLLNENTREKDNIEIHHNAVCGKLGAVEFFEFPTLYSEYNSIYIDQFKKANWYNNNLPKKINVEAVVLGDFIRSTGLSPKMIKIDVEGGEYGVIKGLEDVLLRNIGYIIMEYLAERRDNELHKKASVLLNKKGYKSHLINSSGDLVPCEDVDTYLNENDLDSDNIVFVRND